MSIAEQGQCSGVTENQLDILAIHTRTHGNIQVPGVYSTHRREQEALQQLLLLLPLEETLQQSLRLLSLDDSLRVQAQGPVLWGWKPFAVWTSGVVIGHTGKRVGMTRLA
jgi:hypothetical protein